MKVNTALGMLLSGTALFLLSRPQVSRLSTYVAITCATVLLVMGAVTLMEYLAGWQFGIDELLIRDLTARVGTSTPGRMSPATAFCFVCVGVAMVTVVRPRTMRLRQSTIAALGAVVLTIGLMALIGYAAEYGLGYHWWNYTGTALHTAIAFILLAVGLLALVRSEGGLSWSLDRFNTAAFATGIVLMILAAGSSYSIARQLFQTLGEVSQTQAVLKEIQVLTTRIASLESSQRLFVITGAETQQQRFDEEKAQIPIALVSVLKVISDSPSQHPRLEQLKALLAKRIEFAEATIKARREQGFPAAQQMIGTGVGIALSDSINRLLEDMRVEERALLIMRQQESERASVTTLLLWPLGLFLTLATLFLGVFFLNAGIEQRALAEQSTKETQARLNSTLLAGSIGTWSWNIPNDLLTADEFTAQKFSLEADDAAKGLPAASYLRVIHEEDRPGVEKGLARAIESCGYYDIEYRVRQKDEFLWLQARGRVEGDAAGNALRFDGAVMDITERKQAEAAVRASEEELRLAVEATELGTWDHNPITRERRWSVQSKKIFGFPADADLTSDEVQKRIHPEDRQRTEEAFQDALKSDGSGELALEFRITTENGGLRWIQSKGRASFMDGQATRLIGTMLDITERKRVEGELRSKNGELAVISQQLWQASKLATMGELAASIAHELNNPLTTVTLSVEALMMQLAGDENKIPILETVRTESERMADLVSNLLQFSRRSHAQISTLNIGDEVTRSLDLISYHLSSRNVRVVRETSDNFPMVQGDRQQLLQVFLNLLTNACDAMPD
ncbi:MAG TPA: CHASE3 domain-containing protein, partial [Pyrinomonadaceae bacterium]|nr:CHASE3 domain-containing protein [Pyrinomonadaceae bacterium]